MKPRMLLLTFLAYGALAQCQQQCLTDAWSALDRLDYIGAIRSADSCINEFHSKAERDQADLAKHQEPPPPTGAVSDADKQKIFGRGVLNDTAAAYFVKGKSSEALAKKRKSKSNEYLASARDAYEQAKELTYARVWDPKGWFWSPSQAASDRLADLH